MSEATIYRYVLYAFFALPVLIFPLLFLISAPYGRHVRDGWGPRMNATLGWVVMEAVSPIAFAACFVLGAERVTAPTVVFLAMWQTHYIYRSFIFPFRRRGGAKDMPAMIAINAMVFNLANGYLNGRFLYHFAPVYTTAWFTDPRFIGGVLLFCFGFFINHQSDAILRNLRRPGETGYKVPTGGFYRWISAPNYLGEIVEWVGWALATWSLPGLAFAIWTAANLVPRARTNHRWYQEKFPDYPRERKALIPYVF